jgi:hypothetical protein
MNVGVQFFIAVLVATVLIVATRGVWGRRPEMKQTPSILPVDMPATEYVDFTAYLSPAVQEIIKGKVYAPEALMLFQIHMDLQQLFLALEALRNVSKPIITHLTESSE